MWKPWWYTEKAWFKVHHSQAWGYANVIKMVKRIWNCILLRRWSCGRERAVSAYLVSTGPFPIKGTSTPDSGFACGFHPEVSAWMHTALPRTYFIYSHPHLQWVWRLKRHFPRWFAFSSKLDLCLLFWAENHSKKGDSASGPRFKTRTCPQRADELLWVIKTRELIRNSQRLKKNWLNIWKEHSRGDWVCYIV